MISDGVDDIQVKHCNPKNGEKCWEWKTNKKHLVM